MFKKLVIGLLVMMAVKSTVIAQVPKPADVFGFVPGADYKLADYSQMLDYYTRLDKASKRVSMIEIGKSVWGKPLLLLFISSEKNLARLEHWRSISEQLSRAKIDSTVAVKLSQEGKAVVWIDAGLHASEKACAQMAPELAYNLATSETPEIQKIRDNVITLLMPVMNPDGLDIVASWYRENLNTPFENSSPPWLWHPYVGHDNNRDWFMNNMPETQAVNKVLYTQWYPQVVYNHHQTAPSWTRIFLPPFSNPVNPNIHPGITTGVNLIGAAMADRFAKSKMPGVISQTSYDMWWNGGMRSVPYFHNQIGILTETAQPSPTPRKFSAAAMPASVAGSFGTDGTSIFYPYPWKGGMSRFRDAVDYMLTATMALLKLSAERKEEYLYNIYSMGRDAIDATDKGFAYVIPANQRDGGEARNLVDILQQGGIEVHQASQSFQTDSAAYPAGSFIIYGAQAFRPYIVDLLEKQTYPDLRLYPGGPPDPPYDLTGWTLPYQMGVQVNKVKKGFTAATILLKATPQPVNESTNVSQAAFYVLERKENNSFLAINRLLAKGAGIGVADKAFTDAGVRFGAGTFIIENNPAISESIQALSKEYGLHFQTAAARPSAPQQAVKPFRIGIYKSWKASMDEGWSRWLLQSYGFVVDTLHDKDILQKDLRQYKAILLPEQSKADLLNGNAPGSMPERYCGGIGLEGAVALKNYVAAGGNLVALDAASEFAIEYFGLPVTNVVEGLTTQQFYIPGSLLRLKVDTTQTLAYGMPGEAAASFNRSSAFTIRRNRSEEGGGEDNSTGPELKTIATYSKTDPLMSGWALGANQYIAGRSAVLQAKIGKGNVVLFAFSPQFRGQSRGTYKLLFNALML